MYHIYHKVLMLVCVALLPLFLYSQGEFIHKHHRKQKQVMSSGVTPALIPFHAGDLWGYARPGGEIAIQPEFKEAGLFSRYLMNIELGSKGDTLKYLRQFPVLDHAYARVKKDSLYGLIDERGQYLVPPSSKWPLRFFPVDQRFVWIGVRQPNKEDGDCEYFTVALFDQTGRKATPFMYEKTSCSADCSGETADDPNGNRSLVEGYYCDAGDLNSQYILIFKDDKWGFIQKKDFTVAFPPAWNRVMRPDGGLLLASYYDTISQAYDERWVLVGPGNKVSKTFPAGFQLFGGDRYKPYLTNRQDLWVYVNGVGDTAFPEQFKNARPFSKNGYALVQALSGNWKIIDTSGRVKIDSIFNGGYAICQDGYYFQLKDTFYYEFDRNFKQIGYLGLDYMPENFTFNQKTLKKGSRKRRYGLFDQHDQIVVPFEYENRFMEMSDLPSGHYLQVLKGKLTGLLDTQFHEIIPVRFTGISPTSKGDFLVSSPDRHYGLYSKDGREILEPVYDAIEEAQDPRLGVYSIEKDSLYGTCDADGRIMLPPVFTKTFARIYFQRPYEALRTRSDIWIFNTAAKLLARVPGAVDQVWDVQKADCDTCFELSISKESKTYPIDQQGCMLIPMDSFENAYHRDKWIFVEKNGKGGVFAYPDLKSVVPLNLTVMSETNGKFLVKTDTSPYLLYWNAQKQKAEHFKEPFTTIYYFSEGLAVVQRDCKWYGYVNQDLELVIPMKFSTVTNFSDGIACVRDSNGYYGYIDRSGNWVKKSQFSKANPFYLGRARVEQQDKSTGETISSIVDRQWNVLLQLRHQKDLEIRFDSLFITVSNYPTQDKYVLADLQNGKILLENCSCIRNESGILYWIKDGLLYRAPAEALLRAGTSAGFQPVTADTLNAIRDGRIVYKITCAYPNDTFQIIQICGQSACCDMRGKRLTPFGPWSFHQGYAEQRMFDVYEGNMTKLYDFEGRLLLEREQSGFLPLSSRFVQIDRDQKEELYDLKTNKTVVPPGVYYFSIVPNTGLIQVVDFEQHLIGYCDVEGHRYF